MVRLIGNRIGLGLALLLSSCGTPPSGSGDKAPASTGNRGSGAKLIAVIPKGTSHEFWKSIHAGAQKAQQELANVVIEWKGPAREDQADEQIKVVENFMNRGVDAIVLAPCDKNSLVGVVERARKRNIPVVIIDSGIESKNIDSYVATDNYNGGVIAGRHMGKLLGGKGNVAVLRYQVGSGSTEQREAGFLDAIKKEYPTLKIIADSDYAGATSDESLTKSKNLLTRLGDRLDGIFCPCEPVVEGMRRALLDQKLAGKVKLIGFDTSPTLVAGLKSGVVHGLVLQDPVNMGYLGVKTAMEIIAGKKVQGIISTGENLITPENMDQPRSQELLSPKLAS